MREAPWPSFVSPSGDYLGAKPSSHRDTGHIYVNAFLRASSIILRESLTFPQLVAGRFVVRYLHRDAGLPSK